MTLPQGSRPPGWYDDPNTSGSPRWWDGRQWAPPGGSRPAAVPGYGYGYGSGFRPQNLVEEAKSGRRAALALWVGVACQATQLVAIALYIHELWAQFDKIFSSSSTGRTRGTTPVIALSSTAQAAQGVSQLASLGSLVVYVIFIVWFHRAATNGRDLGISARRSPGWAVGGWFIPIGNLFLPFQSASDFFPLGHPDRKIVGQWWGFYIGSGFSVLVLYAAAFGSVGAGLAVSILPIGLFTMAAVKGRQMIRAALAVHVEVARQNGLVSPDFDPSSPASPAGPYAGGPYAGGPYAGDPYAGGPHAPGPGHAPGASPGPAQPSSPWDSAGPPARDPWSPS